MTADSLTIVRPDDWHLHLRDGAAMASVLPHSARQFARAIVMPNLKPPITTTEQAADYQRRIRTALPSGSPFEPLMTLYLTDTTAPDEIRSCARERLVRAREALPGRSHDELRVRRDGSASLRSHARCDAATWNAAADSWRSDAPAGRCVRSGTRVYRRSAGSDAP